MGPRKNPRGRLTGRELEKEGITWQPQVERRWLAGLLRNEKAVAPLPGFLKTTGVGGRGSEKKRGGMGGDK